MSIANITIMFCKNQEKLVEKYKKGGGELEKEREIEKILRLLRLMDAKALHKLYITALNML